MEQFLATETLIIELLLVVSLVALFVRRLRIPYTVALVVVGLLITFGQPQKISLTPELILSLFIPPLVFEAAFHLDFKALRENWLPIAALAVPGVLLTTVAVGLVVAFGTGLPLTSALVFGALISATDPVAVVALFKALGVPKRLTTLVESESLLNDGTAIVVFKLMVGVALSTIGASAANEGRGGADLLTAAVDFIRVSAGGILIGAGFGWVVAQIIARVDDYLIETMLTAVLAFGAYLVAERFHVSGVLATVAAGIVTGNLGLKGMSPTTRIVLFNFWEVLAFVANSMVFLLIGLDVNLREIGANLVPIAVAVAAVLASRALVVYALTALAAIRRNGVPVPYRHVLFWGGLRGAISLALVLSLPIDIPGRDSLRVMTFGVVLFTLLVQGTSMQFLLKKFRIGEPAPEEAEYERLHGKLLAAQAALHRVKELHQTNLLSAATWRRLEPGLKSEVETALEAQNALFERHPELQSEEISDARREALKAQRAALSAMLGGGLLTESIYDELVAGVDENIAQLHRSEAARDV
jgi:CPA1 family monovalent cation:H+ antiporter